MAVKRRILVIENQRRQYELLIRRLDEYTILPVEEEYSEFTDCVRIFLNQRYPPARQLAAMERIKQIIAGWEERPELLMIDYKLSGAHDGGTGFDMAKALLSDDLLPGLPVVFLSRTPENEEAVMTELQTVTGSTWIAKSYAGATNLDKVYFNKYVKKKLPEILGAPGSERLTAAIDLLIADPFYGQINGALKALKVGYPDLDKLPAEKKGLIFDMLANKNIYTRPRLTKVNNELR